MLINRRNFLYSTAVLVASACTTSSPTRDEILASIVTTRHGKVRGRKRDGVFVFKGVRYGADTGGANRFQLPRPPAFWNGVADALSEGPQCPNLDPDKPLTSLELPESEDCLRLNVWTPEIEDGGKRPVMVWLHGGGLWAGSAAGDYEDWPRRPGSPGKPNPLAVAGPWQEGANLARNQDVVVVSPNHRINVLGQTYLEGLDPAFKGSANLGFFDLILALKWVQVNIASFGGDPDNVTIFGQSGGGQKVSILMSMPAARGLFHKAICMSGPAPLVDGRRYAQDMALRLLSELNIARDNIRALQTLPVEDILRAMYRITSVVGRNEVWGLVEGYAPVAGSYGLPEQPFWYGAPDASRHVPLLIGSTLTEMSFLAKVDPGLSKMGWQEAAEKLKPLFGDQTEAMLNRFRSEHSEDSPWKIYSRVLAHWPTRAFVLKIADEKVRKGGAPVYLYRTDWLSPVDDGVIMSPHAIDVPFVFDTAATDASLNGGGAEAQAMARMMSASWAAFARTGSPHTADLPEWPGYTPDQPATMIFDNQPQLAIDPDPGERAAIQAFMADFKPVGLEPPMINGK